MRVMQITDRVTFPFGLDTQSGRILQMSAHTSDMEGKPPLQGRPGDELVVDGGRLAARQVALNLLATLRHAAGDLNAVRRILNLIGLGASAKGVVRQPDAVTAASEIFVELCGDAGVHARFAIGVAQLPFGELVEIELVIEPEEVK